MRTMLLACMIVLSLNKGGTPASDTLDVDAVLAKSASQVNKNPKRKEQ